jgi:hypothetical protein
MIRKVIATAFCLSLLGYSPVQGKVYDLDKAKAFLSETDVEIRSDGIDCPKPETLAAYREITGCTDFYATDDLTPAYICLVMRNLKNPKSEMVGRMRNGYPPFSREDIHSGMTPDQMIDAVDAYCNANPGFCFLACIGTRVNGTPTEGHIITVIMPSKYKQSFRDLCTRIIGRQR